MIGLVLPAALPEVEDEVPNFAMEFAPENGTPVHMQQEAGAMDLQKPCSSPACSANESALVAGIGL